MMDKDMMIRIAGVRKDSSDDGPGLRTVIFFQGCHMHCPGCQNRETQDPHGGVVWTVGELVKKVKEENYTHKITISGGEPLEQLPGLRCLIRQLENEGFDVGIYTGWNLNRVPLDLFPYLSFIKVGNFQEDLKNPMLHFVGSENQLMYRISHENGNNVLESVNLI